MMLYFGKSSLISGIAALFVTHVGTHCEIEPFIQLQIVYMMCLLGPC